MGLEPREPHLQGTNLCLRPPRSNAFTTSTSTSTLITATFPRSTTVASTAPPPCQPSKPLLPHGSSLRRRRIFAVSAGRKSPGSPAPQDVPSAEGGRSSAGAGAAERVVVHLPDAPAPHDIVIIILLLVVVAAAAVEDATSRPPRDPTTVPLFFFITFITHDIDVFVFALTPRVITAFGGVAADAAFRIVVTLGRGGSGHGRVQGCLRRRYSCRSASAASPAITTTTATSTTNTSSAAKQPAAAPPAQGRAATTAAPSHATSAAMGRSPPPAAAEAATAAGRVITGRGHPALALLDARLAAVFRRTYESVITFGDGYGCVDGWAERRVGG